MKKSFFFILALLIFTNSYTQWTEQTSGVTTALRSVCSTPSSNVAWICGASGVVLKTTNTGTNWINVSSGIPTSNTLICISAVDANLALVVGYSSSTTYMYRTTNGGANWSLVLSETGFYDAVSMVNSTTGFMAGDPVGGRWSLWKTANGGANWDSSGLYLPIVHPAEAGWNNAMSVVYPKIWIGTNDTVVIYSSNFGTSWTRYKTTGEVNGYSLCFDWATGQTGLMAGSVAMLQTSNLGSNWSAVPMLGTGNVVGITFTNLPVDNFTWPAWYVRTSTMIYGSTNGTSWTAQYTAPVGNFNAISQARPGRGIWAVRSNGGISFHTIIADIKKEGNEIPGKYALYQNYPNPFNPVTNIKFQIPRSGYVTLKVFDGLGKEMQTLVEQELKTGYYETKFNAENMPSGVYFYKLTSDGFSDAKKMVIIK
ncbi:MAG: T9SS type A sorting domain-containing protein [Ignavibacteriae bacterium]|nr:T9SS type A sorting domain-containing protein [Ignavibacteriota bacterium]